MRCINYLSEYLVPVGLFYIVGLRCFRTARFLMILSKGRLRGLKRWLESCRRWWD